MQQRNYLLAAWVLGQLQTVLLGNDTAACVAGEFSCWRVCVGVGARTVAQSGRQGSESCL